MGKNLQGGWLGHWRRWLRAGAQARVVCEIAADGVAAVRASRSGQVIEAWSVTPLPENVVRPGPLAENIHETSTLEQVLATLLREVAASQKRVAVILPDLVARVWLLTLESLPQRRQEVLALLRWRLRKEAVFDLEQAVLDYQVYPAEAGKHVLVAAALGSILRQYEERFEALGFEPGWVTLSSLATLGWFEASERASRLLVRRDPGSLSLTIVRQNAVHFFRSVPLAAADGSAAALFEHIYPSLVYFQDHWGEPVTEALLVGLGEEQAALTALLYREAGCLASELKVDAWLGDLPLVTTQTERERRLAAALGYLRAGAQP